MIPADVSAVVVSHDGFSDVWPGFFGLLFRFWPDLPYPLHLISNHLSFPHKRIIPLRVGDDLSWSETLARGLERISSRFVLLMLEDFFSDCASRFGTYRPPARRHGRQRRGLFAFSASPSG